MRNILSILFACLGAWISSNAQSPIRDSGSFTLHKFAQAIGKETYHTRLINDQLVCQIDFKFTDRGSPVPLKATLITTPASEPRELDIKGATSRLSTIDDTIILKGKTAMIKVGDSSGTKQLGALSFPIAGYSPATVQQALIQYWKKHQRPVSIPTLPFGSVQIKQDGFDTVAHNNSQLLLERYTISGLIWGNELLWSDRKGQLICLITNDAEGDKFEAMREGYEPLLNTLIGRAATYSMRLFAGKMALQSKGSAGALAIVGGTLIDVVNKSSLTDAVVLIDKGKITKVGKAGSLQIPAGAKIIDATGKTLVPGLWDMHAHFQQAEWGPAYLAAGVTTVRDCGNEFDYINAIKVAIDQDKGIGPEILKAGIIDGKGIGALGVEQADTKEEAIRLVRRYAANGFVQIKIYSSAKPAIVKVISEEAHRLGLTVTGHIPQGMTLRAGVDSGMDMVNHLPYAYSDMKREPDRSVNLEDSANLAVIRFIKDHHTVMDPTLGVFEMVTRNLKDDITVMEPAFYTLPLREQELFRNTGMDSANAAKRKPFMIALEQIVRRLHEEGVPIVAGTDMGYPGYSLYRELELYVESGLTPIDALQTATIIPARVMQLDHRSGSIEAGKNADLIIVDGDPLRNIREIRKVVTVIRNGRIYDPIQLHRMVEFIL